MTQSTVSSVESLLQQLSLHISADKIPSLLKDLASCPPLHRENLLVASFSIKPDDLIMETLMGELLPDEGFAEFDNGVPEFVEM